MNEWTDWLARTGYAIDYADVADPPPCTLRELAEAYHRIDSSVTVEDWGWCIRANTSAFEGKDDTP